jgi:hypothetical protein
VIDNEGEQFIRHEDIDHYSYNEMDSLYVSFLPPTSYAFNNKKYLFYNRKFYKYFFGGITGGINNIQIKKWQDKFLSPQNALGYEFGIKTGYTLTKSINIAVGLEFGRYKNTIQGDLKSSFNTIYIYLSASYLKSFKISYAFYAGVGFDIGLFKSHGNIYLYSYREIYLKNHDFNAAIRPKIIFHFPITSKFCSDLDIGYFFAKSQDVKILVQSIKNFPVYFNGLTFKLSVYFQIPDLF